MRRREFVTLLCSAAAARPLAVWAQQPNRMRRIGVLRSLAADDPGGKVRLAAFETALRQLGLTAGSNVQIDYRWAAGSAELSQKYAEELVGLGPDILLATSGTNLPYLLRATRTIPIVFVQVADPVGAGFVDSLAQPGGNVTGFITIEYGISAKWPEILKQVAPSVTRAAVLRDATSRAGIGQFGALQSVAPSFGLELTPVGLGDATEIERGIKKFVGAGKGGLIVTASQLAALHCELIVSLAAQHKLPAVYSDEYFVTRDGLASYGPDRVAIYPLAAGYVQRILMGEKPANLPVQAPTKYELAINLKTAKTLGLDVPTSLLARANEVIE
jgi:putative ABC transport system substrate-binding protein